MSNTQLFVIIFDRDQKVFNVQGPFRQTTKIERRVSKMQESGRNLVYVRSNRKEKENIIAQKQAAHKDYHYVPEALV